MAFPRKLLIPGEQLILELRPHFVAVLLPTIAAVVATALAIWATTAASGFIQTLIWLAWLVFLVIYPLRRYVWWFTSNFVVTSSRVIHREGFIAKRSMEIPLDKINDVRFEQGIFERIVGAGTLIIQSASESGRNEFSFIRHPEEVQRTIYAQSEKDQHQTLRQAVTGTPAAPPPPPAAPASSPSPAAPSSVTELERLADLRARGVLTQEEFEAQKAKILGQG